MSAALAEVEIVLPYHLIGMFVFHWTLLYRKSPSHDDENLASVTNPAFQMAKATWGIAYESLNDSNGGNGASDAPPDLTIQDFVMIMEWFEKNVEEFEKYLEDTNLLAVPGLGDIFERFQLPPERSAVKELMR